MSTLCNCNVTLYMVLSFINVIYGQNLTDCENITQGTNSSSQLTTRTTQDGKMKYEVQWRY
jgi:hypothetical protein